MSKNHKSVQSHWCEGALISKDMVPTFENAVVVTPLYKRRSHSIVLAIVVL